MSKVSSSLSLCRNSFDNTSYRGQPGSAMFPVFKGTQGSRPMQSAIMGLLMFSIAVNPFFLFAAGQSFNPLFSANWSLCDSYTTTVSTLSATQNTFSCEFVLCPGESVTASMCGEGGASLCTGDTEFRMLDPMGGSLLIANDDGGMATSTGTYCGLCSRFTYTYNLASTSCYWFTLNQGCHGNMIGCTGRTALTKASSPHPLWRQRPSSSLNPTPRSFFHIWIGSRPLISQSTKISLFPPRNSRRWSTSIFVAGNV